MENAPENRPPVFNTTDRIERDGAGGLKYTLYLNLQNRTMAHIEIWAREPRHALAALEAAMQRLEKQAGRVVVPNLVS